LLPRLEFAPEALRSRILEAVEERTLPTSLLSDVGTAERRNCAEDVGTAERRNVGSVEATLRGLAEQLLEQAKIGTANHETALTLLAADALITYACEAAAEAGSDAAAGPG
jgi:hypothetical protein